MPAIEYVKGMLKEMGIVQDKPLVLYIDNSRVPWR